jgi:hypothetical protein
MMDKLHGLSANNSGMYIQSCVRGVTVDGVSIG